MKASLLQKLRDIHSLLLRMDLLLIGFKAVEKTASQSHLKMSPTVQILHKVCKYGKN